VAPLAIALTHSYELLLVPSLHWIVNFFSGHPPLKKHEEETVHDKNDAKNRACKGAEPDGAGSTSINIKLAGVAIKRLPLQSAP
jgi:hypothetical protein